MSNVLRQLLVGAAPALLQRAGIPLPQGFGPEHVEEALNELGGTPAQRMGENLLVKYYKVRSSVNDTQFRDMCEAVFDDPRFEAQSQEFLKCCAAIVNGPQTTRKVAPDAADKSNGRHQG